jgi:adenylate kinase family enzyme
MLQNKKRDTLISLTLGELVTTYAIMFIGQSGSGKETHKNNYLDFLKKHSPGVKTISVCTGDEFRKWIQNGSTLAQSIQSANASGKLQPTAYALYMVLVKLDKKYTGVEHIVLDGSPRSLVEAKEILGILTCLNLKPLVIYPKISDATARKRLKSRNRGDSSNDSAITNKLKFFWDHVIPALKFLKGEDVPIIELDGEKPADKVFEELKKKLNIAHV